MKYEEKILTSERILECFQELAGKDSYSAFDKIYNHYYNKLFRQALFYMKHPDEAQEIVADVFIALWQTRKILDKVRDPDAYLFIALKHARSKYISKYYCEKHELLTDELPDILSDSSTDLSLVNTEMTQKYQSALSKLPPRCAEVFRLVRIERKKYSEAAEILNISVKTVDNQMNKAVKILYSELKEHLFSIFF